MKTFESIGIQIPSVLLPRPGVNMQKWAVVACDQYTSQPGYWERVEKFVGDAPSTLHLVLPEIYIEDQSTPKRIDAIQHKMQEALQSNFFEVHHGLILVERTIEGRTRRGVMLALDLEKYDYTKGSGSLIRATEGTIVERLPPRVKIRAGAELELPHILVLIDDPQRTVIEPLVQQKGSLKKLYDFELMFDSGRLTGYEVLDASIERTFVSALEALSNPAHFSSSYDVPRDTSVLLFAMGDGNHSLATAKAIWQKIKEQAGPDHPARYALVEIVNIHDEALSFEPIHRVLFNLKTDIINSFQGFFGSRFEYEPLDQLQSVLNAIQTQKPDEHCIGFVNERGFGLVRITNPETNLPVGSLQAFLDAYLDKDGADKIDYIHGDEIVTKLGSIPGNVGFYLPPLKKSDFFKTVIMDGSLPRKSFSMGKAHEKRFYVEARKITP